jgi:hypothetical protein
MASFSSMIARVVESRTSVVKGDTWVVTRGNGILTGLAEFTACAAPGESSWRGVACGEGERLPTFTSLYYHTTNVRYLTRRKATSKKTLSLQKDHGEKRTEVIAMPSGGETLASSYAKQGSRCSSLHKLPITPSQSGSASSIETGAPRPPPLNVVPDIISAIIARLANFLVIKTWW